MTKLEQVDKTELIIKEAPLQNGLDELTELLGNDFASQFDGVINIWKREYVGGTTVYAFTVKDRRVVVKTGIQDVAKGTSEVYIQYTTVRNARVHRMAVDPRAPKKVAVGKPLESNAITSLYSELSAHGKPTITRFRQRRST